MGIEKIDGRVLSVHHHKDGSAVTQAYSAGATTLDVEDATDFHEEGGTLVLPDGSKPTYDSADMDDDTITLTSGLTIDLEDEDYIRTFPVRNQRWAMVEVYGYEDPLRVRIRHQHWSWLKLGAREEGKQEPVTIVFDGDDWVIWDIEGARPKVSADVATACRTFRYTAEGVGEPEYKGVRFEEDYAGTVESVRMKIKGGAVTSDATFDLLLNGSSIQTMVVSAGEQFSPRYSLDQDFEAGDKFRVEMTDPADALPDIVVWVHVDLDSD